MPYIFTAILWLFTLAACGGNGDNSVQADGFLEKIEALERENANLEESLARMQTTLSRMELITIGTPPVVSDGGRFHFYEIDCGGDCEMLELPLLWADISGVERFTKARIEWENEFDEKGNIRVFERGNANIRLLPDGTFIANLWHNTKISGTYTEMTLGNETAVLFTHNGKTLSGGGVNTFVPTGFVTVVGGIVDGILTMPEDWDDGHNHGMEFAFIQYPLVFVGENNQRITMFADKTFTAEFSDGIKIIGYYGIRATSVTFVPGSPSFSGNGVPVGSFLLAGFVSCSDVNGGESVPDPGDEPNPGEGANSGEDANQTQTHNQQQNQNQEQTTSQNTNQNQGQTTNQNANQNTNQNANQNTNQNQNQEQTTNQNANQNQDQTTNQNTNQNQEQTTNQNPDTAQHNNNENTDDCDDCDEPQENHNHQQEPDLDWCDECGEYH